MNPYLRYPLIYGLLTGGVIIAVLIATMTVLDQLKFTHSVWFGYLVQLVAMTFVLVGVKHYRDVEKGGVIRFLPALGMALLIVLVAVAAYVLIWEVYMAATNDSFMDKYIAAELAHMKATGKSATEIAQAGAAMRQMADEYNSHPFYRMGMTVIEIAPTGAIMAILSAIAVRFPKFLPAR